MKTEYCQNDTFFICINKINSMLRAPNCPFILYGGNKKLIKEKNLLHAHQRYNQRKSASIKNMLLNMKNMTSGVDNFE